MDGRHEEITADYVDSCPDHGRYGYLIIDNCQLSIEKDRERDDYNQQVLYITELTINN
jgi:hypothetical protein